jgi:hypothetical protein
MAKAKKKDPYKNLPYYLVINEIELEITLLEDLIEDHKNYIKKLKYEKDRNNIPC